MLNLAQLADYLDGVLYGNADHAIFSLSSLSCATSKDLAYFDNLLLKEELQATLAGVVLLKSEHQSLCLTSYIVVPNPLAAMQKAVKYLEHRKSADSGVHPAAQIHPSASLAHNVSIGAHALIGARVQLGGGVCIGANTIIESGVSIGPGTQIGNGVVIHSGSRLGMNVLINSGCIIGSYPFNYLKEHGQWQQGPAVGGVIISEKVHIGANTVIDRGSLGDTYLAQGVCIDNLVQIAHDVIIGPNTAIAGCAAIGAQAQIGSDCIIGGASCVAANVQLADDVVITGMSTVSKSINKSGIYTSGTMVHEHQRWRRNAARFRRLDDYITKLAQLEKRIGS